MLFKVFKRFFRQSNTSVGWRITYALLGALVLNILFGVLFYFAERGSQPELTLEDSIWWGMVTMTTVGYGDFSPQTFVGRFLVGYPCFLIGIGLIGYLLGTLAESLIDITSRKRKGQIKIRMKDHIIICHCPTEAKVLSMVDEIRATAGYKTQEIVVVANNLDELPPMFRKKGLHFVKGEPTQEEVLFQAGLKESQGVVILSKKPGCPESDAVTFAIGSVVELVEEEIGRSIRSVAEVVSPKNRKLFDRSSIDGAVIVEGVTDKLMVQEFLHPGIHGTFEQLLTNTTGSQFYTCETKLQGQRLVDIQAAALQHPQDLQIIGLRRNGEPLLNPSKQIVIEPGDMLLVLAEAVSQYNQFEADYAVK